MENVRRRSIILSASIVLVLAIIEAGLLFFYQQSREKTAQLQLLQAEVVKITKEMDGIKHSQSSVSQTSGTDKSPRITEIPTITSRPKLELTQPEGLDLRHLVQMTNLLSGKENRMRVTRINGATALQLTDLDLSSEDPFWQVLNLVHNAGLLKKIHLVGSDSSLSDRKDLVDEMSALGFPEELIQLQKSPQETGYGDGILLELRQNPQVG